jgi:hypothetical protein
MPGQIVLTPVLHFAIAAKIQLLYVQTHKCHFKKYETADVSVSSFTYKMRLVSVSNCRRFVYIKVKNSYL